MMRVRTMVYCCWTAGVAFRGPLPTRSVRHLSVLKAEKDELKLLPGMRPTNRRSRRERKRTIDLSVAPGDAKPTTATAPKRRRASKTKALDALVGEYESPQDRGAKIIAILLSDFDMGGEAIVQSLEVLCHLDGFAAVKEGYVARASSLSFTELERASKVLAGRNEFEILSSVAKNVDYPSSVYGPLVSAMMKKNLRVDVLPLIEEWLEAVSPDQSEESPVWIFNEALTTARKTRSLRAVFRILDVMNGCGVEGDNETFDIISHAAVRNLDFVLGAVSLDTIPQRNDKLMEAVLVGRSNVGKSSLVNMVTNRKSAAYVSKTPGKTQQFNYFLVNSPPPPPPPSNPSKKKNKKPITNKTGKAPWDPEGTFYLVDVPGLGYAEVPKELRKDWNSLLSDYISQHQPLAVLLHLIDSRVGAVDVDFDIFKMIKAGIDHRKRNGLAPIRYSVVLTKADKKDGRRNLNHPEDPLVDRVRRQLLEATQDEDVAQSTPILVTSSVTRRGRDAVWRQLRYAAIPDAATLPAAASEAGEKQSPAPEATVAEPDEEVEAPAEPAAEAGPEPAAADSTEATAAEAAAESAEAAAESTEAEVESEAEAPPPPPPPAPT